MAIGIQEKNNFNHPGKQNQVMTKSLCFKNMNTAVIETQFSKIYVFLFLTHSYQFLQDF